LLTIHTTTVIETDLFKYFVCKSKWTILQHPKMTTCWLACTHWYFVTSLKCCCLRRVRLID
jgi:hypothetical protein